MRNLKRVLSLTLASVMLLGLMVVGAGAVDYPDVDAVNDNIEAIEVLGALGIFEGDDNGEFRPAEEVTRAEMAKIMAVTLGLDYQRYEGAHPFTDTVGHWAESYIAACTANKVINGRGNGIYDPSATVTAIEASAMLMRAMGYFKYASDVEDGFEIATMAQANKIGLYDGIEGSAYNGMPRNDVAQLVLNGLQCTMVEVTSTGTTITTSDGTVVNTGRANYGNLYTESSTATGVTDNKYGKIGAGTYIPSTGVYHFTIELGEDLFDGKLVLNNDEEDAFGRPAHQWKYNNKEIGTYGKKADLTYTKAVKGKDIWADLGKPSTMNGTYYAIDGDTSKFAEPSEVDTDHSVDKDGDKNVYTSGKGVLLQVYYDESTGNVKTYAINTYLAKVLSDYNEDDDSLSIEVKGNIASQMASNELSGEDFAISGYEKDDYLLITAAYDSDESGYVVQSVSPATVVSGVTVSEYKSGDSGNITTGDNKTYDYSYIFGNDTFCLGGESDSDIKDDYDFDNGEYDLYLDQYGYIIGVAKTAGGAELSDYLFVTDAAQSGFVYQAKVVFMDGTTQTVTVSKVAGAGGTLEKPSKADPELAGGSDIGENTLTGNCFYSYKVDKNGEYQLTSVGADGDAQGKIETDTASTYGIASDADNPLYPLYYGTTFYGASVIKPVNAKTVFITDEQVYVGLKNTPKVTITDGKSNIYYMLSDDTTYIAAIYTPKKGTATTGADEWFYIYNEASVANDYVTYDVVQGTSKTTLKVDNSGKTPAQVPGLYKIESYTSDGYAEPGLGKGTTYFVAEDTDTDGKLVYSVNADVANIKWSNGVLTINDDDSYYVDDDAQIYRVNANDKGKSVSTSSAISASSLNGLASASNGYDIYLIMKEEDSFEVAIAYFVRRNA